MVVDATYRNGTSPNNLHLPRNDDSEIEDDVPEERVGRQDEVDPPPERVLRVVRPARLFRDLEKNYL